MSRDYSPRTSEIFLALILILSLIVRFGALNHGPYGLDSFNYCIGALKFHVAHPPGYAGYVALGTLINSVAHHINRSFIGISMFAALGAVWLVYVLGRLMGFTTKTSLAAALAYSVSANSLTFSTLAMNYTLESFLAVAFVSLVVLAIKRRSRWVGIAATVVFAASGAARPTTTFFLIPLWVYFLWKQRPAVAILILHILIAGSLVGAWQFANSHLLARAGFHGNSFAFQVMMPVNYDYVSLNSKLTTAGVAHAAYHMPGFEMLVWGLERLHLPLVQAENWPEPSINRAALLSAIQFSKLCYFLVFSVPALLLLPFVWKEHAGMWQGGRRWILIWWILPAVLFFIVGHLGSIGYLLFFLPGVSLWIASLIFEPGRTSNVQKTFYLTAAASAGFFVLARPFKADAGWRRTVDILALVDTASAIRDGYSVSRNSPPGPVDPKMRAMTDAPSDEAFLKAAEAVNYTPVPVSGAASD